MDDNFGEAIHLHIDDFRVDLTVKEFGELYEQICDVLNELIKVEGFDAHKIDSVFLECMLWKDILHLTKITFDEVKLSDLLIAGKPIKTLANSNLMKSLKGNDKFDIKRKESDYQTQTRKERRDRVADYVGEKGYPYDGKYIILYGDDNVIKDGQHRAVALLNNKDQVVTVQRYYFDNYKPVNKMQMNMIGSRIFHIYTIISNIKGTKDFIKKTKMMINPFIIKILGIFKNINKFWYRVFHKKQLKHELEVLGKK